MLLLNATRSHENQDETDVLLHPLDGGVFTHKVQAHSSVPNSREVNSSMPGCRTASSLVVRTMDNHYTTEPPARWSPLYHAQLGAEQRLAR